MAIINICELECLLNNPIILGKFPKLKISTSIEENGETVNIGEVDLKNNKFSVNREFVEVEKRMGIREQSSCMRTSRNL